MAANTQHAARLREMLTAIRNGSPINTSGDVQAALEEAASMLEGGKTSLNAQQQQRLANGENADGEPRVQQLTTSAPITDPGPQGTEPGATRDEQRGRAATTGASVNPAPRSVEADRARK